jgi:hypothetical protein
LVKGFLSAAKTDWPATLRLTGSGVNAVGVIGLLRGFVALCRISHFGNAFFNSAAPSPVVLMRVKVGREKFHFLS